ncbi:hypothetical protein QJQ45_005127 [Haematococcus lacustris]|nr:hypothetical protein QJQ45_005127 [Haematococcus lacustris]
MLNVGPSFARLAAGHRASAIAQEECTAAAENIMAAFTTTPPPSEVMARLAATVTRLEARLETVSTENLAAAARLEARLETVSAQNQAMDALLFNAATMQQQMLTTMQAELRGNTNTLIRTSNRNALRTQPLEWLRNENGVPPYPPVSYVSLHDVEQTPSELVDAVLQFYGLAEQAGAADDSGRRRILLEYLGPFSV